MAGARGGLMARGGLRSCGQAGARARGQAWVRARVGSRVLARGKLETQDGYGYPSW
jgi:hypothetical protein